MLLNFVFNFTPEEKALTKKLNTPAKVQDFLNRLPFNFEKRGETLRSPLFALRAKRAHCFEGALLGAYILSQHGFRPFLMHLKAQKEDYDHVVVPFKIGKFWGALSKTNHAVLRYREPVYGNIRELAMSYFHEYFLNNGQKTLRQYSALLNLNMVKKNWATSKEDLWSIDKALDKVKHYDMVPKSHIKNLRRADEIEIKAGKIVEWRN
ncbi:hypothetical protein A3A11_01745 [Candidatus Nomurabacteria bacterium RIFCSPLOWO2_01_FULL_43_15]|nr:MAG: hypothetical protein A3A11_01745 [Candidatus Nomurabacteria bacterium RIFCSPLOWO2_01_FULL_43_15]